MTTDERFKKFDADFGKLKRNRENIPLDRLTTRYTKAYNALLADLEEFAEWFTGEYIKTLAIPQHPKDEAGNAWLQKKVDAILAEERKPGGLYQQLRDALIDDLDREKFEDRVWRIHDRLMREAYDPYQQRFNKWVGQPDKRWIYNSLFDAFWKEDLQSGDGGYWIDMNHNYKMEGYRPQIKVSHPMPEGKSLCGVT